MSAMNDAHIGTKFEEVRKPTERRTSVPTNSVNTEDISYVTIKIFMFTSINNVVRAVRTSFNSHGCAR